ncbi:hypothetical protein EI982_03895 [Haloplanus rallus]|jgi:hypothetical protein|uniref:Uncharacterized protein n=1 Tax=Haloplanus rallus TaxID=1816183 RepID=A0A6B9F6K7_9EURY|nr:hypothetical protein [Haloplanus rallus]QGX93981.1 hypothetical protein EI982_03895 [Haloplanus rallus]
MSDSTADPRCPNCGGPIGRTATYCMHCSADLTEERAAADADDDGVWDEAEAEAGTEAATDLSATPPGSRRPAVRPSQRTAAGSGMRSAGP